MEEKTENKITRQTTMGEIVSKYPETVELIQSKGLHCVGCHISPYETLEQGCRGHGWPDEIIDSMIRELNELIKLKSEKDEHVIERTNLSYMQKQNE